MEENTENKEWMKAAPLLAGMPVNNPFSVPEGYFEGLTDQITDRVYVESLKAEAGDAGFTTPPDYFNQLKENIHAEIAAERIRVLTPHDGYAVPTGYFDQLQRDILAKTTSVKETRIVRLWHSKVLKYASAACFLLIASTGLYFNQHHPANPVSVSTTADLATDQMLYDIDEQVIIDHIQDNDPKPETTVEEAALETYILSNYSQNELAGNL